MRWPRSQVYPPHVHIPEDLVAAGGTMLLQDIEQVRHLGAQRLTVPLEAGWAAIHLQRIGVIQGGEEDTALIRSYSPGTVTEIQRPQERQLLWRGIDGDTAYHERSLGQP